MLTFIGTVFSQNNLILKADNVQVTEDESVNINILKNDNIKDKSNLVIEIIGTPKKGTVQVQGKQLIYTPNLNETGIDKFSYKVDTGVETGSAQVKVSINPVNDPPVSLSLKNNKIMENASPGTLIGKLKVEDPDINDIFKYGLAKENRDDFKLEGPKVLTKRSFNFEEQQLFVVSIQVTDSGDEKFIGTVNVKVQNQNESPILESQGDITFNHFENSGKIIGKLNVIDPDDNQSNVKYKLTNSDDRDHFKITRSGDISFLRLPDYENPLDKNKDNIYKLSFNAFDSKDEALFVSGKVIIKVNDAKETEVVTLDKRKYISWTVDHQPYHILLEDAIKNYMSLKYSNLKDGGTIEDGQDTFVREMQPTDQVIIVQDKDNKNEIYEIWYGNGLDFTIIDREKIDWVFSQDIQNVLIAKDEYLTSDSETVFYESERDRLMAGYGSIFSVWHANNFKMSLSSFSMRSNLLQYSSNMRIGNELIGLPGLLAGSSELGVATQRSEFGIRVPFSFDLGKIGGYDGIDVVSDEYLGLYARGNIENIFSTKTNLYALMGFTFYPSSSGEKLYSPQDLSNKSLLETSYWKDKNNDIENINILDSYALAATTVEVPVKLPTIGRLTASPGFHYLKLVHKLKDSSEEADSTNRKLLDRTFYNQKLSLDSLASWKYDQLNNEGNSYTRLRSFYIRFDLTGQIGEKPKFIERLSFLDFIQLSKVPFYEISLQYISGLNMITTVNLNISDEIGVSFTRLSKNESLEGNWMSNNIWVGLNYRANF